MAELRESIEVELKKAELARSRGNEGQARVCARRAAGLAARDYLSKKGTPSHNPSAYDVLRAIADNPTLPAQLRLYAEHLTLRVNEEFRLPPGIDLIAEARQLCEELLAHPA